jgi:hypothetical protein
MTEVVKAISEMQGLAWSSTQALRRQATWYLSLRCADVLIYKAQLDNYEKTALQMRKWSAGLWSASPYGWKPAGLPSHPSEEFTSLSVRMFGSRQAARR